MFASDIAFVINGKKVDPGWILIHICVPKTPRNHSMKVLIEPLEGIYSFLA